MEDINNWLKRKQSIPSYRLISNYIKKQKIVSDLVELVYNDDRYKDIRKRCNQNVHYNFYDNLLLNDNEIHRTDRVLKLDMFLDDLNALFVQRFALILSINEYYMMSSDYIEIWEWNHLKVLNNGYLLQYKKYSIMSLKKNVMILLA